MGKDASVAIISIDDVVHTLKECDRDWKYSDAVEHMMLFASELTGFSIDALSEMMYGEGATL